MSKGGTLSLKGTKYGMNGNTSKKVPTPRSIYERSSKKPEPDDLPGHAQTSRARPDIGREIKSTSFKPGGAKKRLKGVML
jgi:hypothetical protein